MNLIKHKRMNMAITLVFAVLCICFQSYAQTIPKQTTSNENAYQNGSPNPNRYEASMNLPKVSALQPYPYTRRDFLSNIKLALDEGWFLRDEMYNGRFLGELLGIRGEIVSIPSETSTAFAANSASRAVPIEKRREQLMSTAPYFDRRGGNYAGGIKNTVQNKRRTASHGLSISYPDIYIEDLEAVFGKKWRFRPIDGIPHHRGPLPIITDPFGLDRIQYSGSNGAIGYLLSIDFSANGSAMDIEITIEEK
jgi:hypothetical protein